MKYETIKQVLDSHKNEKLTDKTIKQIMFDISMSSLFEFKRRHPLKQGLKL